MTLFMLQRLSAKLLAPLVIVHVGVILYATHGGLSAEEILLRTRGSFVWGTLYTFFVLAAAVHAPIGLRNVIDEWTPWHGRSLDWASVSFAVVLLMLGLRAVWAVVG
jgi:fumarate reductase subunit C